MAEPALTGGVLDSMAVAKLAGRRFPWYRKLAFGTGHVLMVLSTATWFSYSVAFFERVLQISAHNTGTIFVASQAFGAIAIPFFGMWSDQCECKFGRRKIFLLMANVAVAASLFFVWHDCLGCQSASQSYQVLYFTSWACIYQIGAVGQITTLSLVPELARSKSEKVELNSIRFAFTIIGSLITFVIFWILLEELSGSGDVSSLSPDEKEIFWIMALVVIFVGGSLAAVFLIFIHERGDVQLPKKKWYRWLKNPKFYLAGLTFLAARTVVQLSQTYLPLYMLDTLRMDKTSIAKGPLIQFIASFVFTLLVKRCNKYLGPKMTYFIGLTLVWGGGIWFWVKGATDDDKSFFNIGRDSIYGATILIGGGGATLYVMSLTFLSTVVGRYTGSSAFVYGWVLFADRLNLGVAVKIVQSLQPASESAYAAFYRGALVYVPFYGTALGLLGIALMLILECGRRRRSSRELLVLSIQGPSLDGSREERRPLLRRPSLAVQHPRLMVLKEKLQWMLCCKKAEDRVHVQVEERGEREASMQASQEYVVQDELESDDLPVDEDLGFFGMEESMLMSV